MQWQRHVEHCPPARKHAVGYLVSCWRRLHGGHRTDWHVVNIWHSVVLLACRSLEFTLLVLGTPPCGWMIACMETSSTCRAVSQTWNWVIGSPGQWVIWVIFHVRVTGSSFWLDVRPEFFRFSKKCPKCKTYIWNAEMRKVIVRCLLLDWNHWMSVHAMNFYFYLWLFKILWPESTSSHISQHLEFIIEHGHRVNCVSASLDSRVTGSLGHKMWPSSIAAVSVQQPVTVTITREPVAIIANFTHALDLPHRLL